MPAAWDVTLGSSSIAVAVLDTGLALAHPDMAGQWSYAPGRTPAAHVFLSNPSGLCAPVVTPEDDGWQDPLTPFSHGTHVAGTIAARTNNGTGVAGIASGARIQPLKVLDCTGDGWFSDISEAITFAADNGARIINMSLGAILGSCPSILQEAIDDAFARGVFITAAAGNAGTPQISFPAGCSNVVSVGATDNSDVRAWFSQFPSSQIAGVDVSAPGVDIWSAFRDTTGAYDYALGSGTSMATPHVAGCVALMLSANPSLGPATIEALLESTAVDLGAPGWDALYGVGRIDCAAAVTQAGGSSATPTVTPTPGTPTATFTPTATATNTPAPPTSTSTSVPPASGSSASLNGSTAYIQAPHHPELTSSNWTFELWFRDENPSYNHPRTRILTKGEITSAEVPYFASIGSNLLTVGLRSGGSAVAIMFNLATGGVTPNAWHHLAATLDGSTRLMIVYIDGVERARNTLAFASSGNNLPLIVGRSGPTGEYFHGKLDDVRLWNLVRSPAEVVGSYQAPLAAPPTGLVANWRLDEGSGNQAADSAGVPQNAALLGGATWSTDAPIGAPPITPTATQPPAPTATHTPTPTATNTATPLPPTATNTPTPVPPTATSTMTPVPTTLTDVPAPSATPTDLPAPSATPTDVPAPTTTPTDVPAPTATPTDVPVPTATPTEPATATPTASSTATATPTMTTTATSTSSPTPSATATSSPTSTATRTPTATPTSALPGGLNSLSLNGTTAYAEAPHHAELTSSSWTFEVWFRDENPNYNHPRARILTKGDIGSSEVPYFASIGSNVLTVGLRSGGSAAVTTFNLATGGVTPNAWHHLAATVDGPSHLLVV
jgi:Subtilase family/Concanavalin A-like lectin/glucanases superfamily